MEKEFNYVYITTNILNGKRYIGSHSTNTIDDNYLGSGRYFLRVLKKEGKENFKREILQECQSILKARELEGQYIEKYNTLYPNGYNLSPKGGIGFKGASHSEETRKKQGEWQKGKTYEELYGREKAAIMKEKQRQRKLGTTTKRKGKGHKQELIEKYGEEEGLKKYNEFTEKQSKSHIGKTQSKETIEKRKQSIGEPWNKGKKYKVGKYDKERIEKVRLSLLKNFYKRLDKEKILIIKKMFNEQKTYKEMTKITGYSINKLKRIIKEELWAA